MSTTTLIKNITLPSYDSNDPIWLEFYRIFKSTLSPDIPMRVFYAYLFANKPIKIDLSFIYEDDELIGFIEASFYYTQLKGKRYTIARGAAGIIPGKSGGKLPSFELCIKYMRYKFKHPFENIFITGYMANPILYAMICNHTHRVYPKYGIPPSSFVNDLKIEILRANNLLTHLKDEHLVLLHFVVKLTEQQKARIEASRNSKHIGFYLKLNPDYGNKHGLFTIIPLDWRNIASSIWMGLIKKKIIFYTKSLGASQKKGIDFRIKLDRTN